MSNLSIIEQLEAGTSELEAKPQAAVQFAKFLHDSIEALEGVPYGLVVEMRRHKNRLEEAGYVEEEGCVSDLPQVVADLRNWLVKIKAQNC